MRLYAKKKNYENNSPLLLCVLSANAHEKLNYCVYLFAKKTTEMLPLDTKAQKKERNYLKINFRMSLAVPFSKVLK